MPVNAIERPLPRPRTTAETKADPLFPVLVEYASLAADDPRREHLRAELVTGYLPMAERIASRFGNRGEPLDDLVQVATVGLICAIDRFEPDLGTAFASFAVPTIRGEIRRHFRDRGWCMRVPRRLKELHLSTTVASTELSQQLGRAPRPSEIAERMELPVEDVLAGLSASLAYRATSLDEPVADGPGEEATLGDRLGSLDPDIEFVEEQNALRPLLAKLADRERTIVMLRFYGNMTQTEIADRIGISQMHVSRLLSQTLTWLREQLRG